MLKRVGGYLLHRDGPVPEASRQLEGEGYALLPGVLGADELAAARAEIVRIYETMPADGRARFDDDDFRYEMFNKCGAARNLVARREILDVIEPLLGEDCHIIANTCWRNKAGAEHRHGGGGWHIDAGPHIPRAPGVAWPADVPYPVFAIGVHVFLDACSIECGPTAVIPGSHKSGRPPPANRRDDETLRCEGRAALPLVADAGDAALFVSDVWHRRLPTREGDTGRFFLQIHYARRDIAQRVKPTRIVNHVDAGVLAGVEPERERRLFGLHPRGFYDG